MKIQLIPIFIFSIFLSSFSQNTIGIITNESESYNGLTLFAPNHSTETYLVNNCGVVVHQWTSNYSPSASVYLLENGNLLRTASIDNDDINFGGVGGRVELFDWDSNLLWSYNYTSPLISQHHDVYPLPNGNILMLAVTTISEEDAIQAGRDPNMLSEGKLYNEQILELEPVGSDQANIVWEWNVIDHVVQDFDSNLNNFGVVQDNPQLLDINYLNENSPEANWLHINSIQYNEQLDQIIMSSRRMSEIYIIDHSTTTQEAASHSGGIYGKGGDFLFRWGNPEAYDKGNSENQTLFSQHYPHWIDNGLTDAGKIIVFNNGNSRGYSSVDIISPPQISPGVYEYNNTSGFEPLNAEWTYSSPTPSDFYSAILSSGQRLPNGNTLICDGDSGYFFEITPANEIVWEYINPDSRNGILTQGDSPSLNNVFRALKFSYDYPAFMDRDLTPQEPIELDPDLSNCTLLNIKEFNSIPEITLYPNPTTKDITVVSERRIEKLELYNSLGQLIKTKNYSNSIDLSNNTTGVYILRIYTENGILTKKILKK